MFELGLTDWSIDLGGGKGFVGQRLVQLLRERGFQHVWVISRKSDGKSNTLTWVDLLLRIQNWILLDRMTFVAEESRRRWNRSKPLSTWREHLSSAFNDGPMPTETKWSRVEWEPPEPWRISFGIWKKRNRKSSSPCQVLVSSIDDQSALRTDRSAHRLLSTGSGERIYRSFRGWQFGFSLTVGQGLGTSVGIDWTAISRSTCHPPSR